MSLGNIWFVIDALFWTGFFVLEGFDFGVGIVHSFIGRNEGEQRVAVNAIGPFWDGNEVWLIVAGAVIFAAFPAWYATMFSSLYLGLVLLLAALMLRGVSFEYARKVDHPRWRTTFRWTLTGGSVLIPFVVGLALGDLLHGLPIDSAHNYTGSFWDLFVPYGIWTGVTLVVMSVLMGTTFLALKTEGELRGRAGRWSAGVGVLSIITVWAFVTWTHLQLGVGFVPNPLEVFAVLSVIAAAWFAREKQEMWAFAAACCGMAGTVGSLFAELYPRVMVSSTNSAYNLTIANSASPSYSLKVMTVVAVIFFPLVLLYQGWNYHIFRRRLSAPRVSADPVEGGDAPVSDPARVATPSGSSGLPGTQGSPGSPPGTQASTGTQPPPADGDPPSG